MNTLTNNGSSIHRCSASWTRCKDRAASGSKAIRGVRVIETIERLAQWENFRRNRGSRRVLVQATRAWRILLDPMTIENKVVNRMAVIIAEPFAIRRLRSNELGLARFRRQQSSICIEGQVNITNVDRFLAPIDRMKINFFRIRSNAKVKFVI